MLSLDNIVSAARVPCDNALDSLIKNARLPSRDVMRDLGNRYPVRNPWMVTKMRVESTLQFSRKKFSQRRGEHSNFNKRFHCFTGLYGKYEGQEMLLVTICLMYVSSMLLSKDQGSYSPALYAKSWERTKGGFPSRNSSAMTQPNQQMQMTQPEQHARNWRKLISIQTTKDT